MVESVKRSVGKWWRGRRSQLTTESRSLNSGFDRYVLQRFGRLRKVWRFVIGWTALMLLLIGCLLVQINALGGYYQSLQPVAGGIYNEGVIGSFTNSNPIYATNDVDKTVSRLLFPGLFRYDDNNKLVGDLASSWSVNATSTVYTVQLRHGLKWQDGRSLTAQDVVFTYKVIQNPDARSPIQSNWAGIKVAASGGHTVTFTLPNPLASFIYGATNGIVPQHLLAKIPMVDMRSAPFNSNAPVGSGPFAWHSISVSGDNPQNAQEVIGLLPFDGYWKGAPKLNSFVVHAYADRNDMIADYEKGELTAMAGLEKVPVGLSADTYQQQDITLAAATMAFFKTTAGVLQDKAVRQALVGAANLAAVIDKLGYNARPVTEPILLNQLGYNASFMQATNDPVAADKLLDAAGWIRTGHDIRTKNNKPLRFTLTLADTPEYHRVASVLQQQWRAVGVDVRLNPLDDTSFQSVLANHDYEAVLYGIAVGADPDVYVYWDSSQADIRSANRLNLSEYSSPVADTSLEAGRTRTDPSLRIIKYQAFLQQWKQDAPALGLYQPRYLYISRVKVNGLHIRTMNTPSDRLNNVNNWMIRTARVSDK